MSLLRSFITVACVSVAAVILAFQRLITQGYVADFNTLINEPRGVWEFITTGKSSLKEPAYRVCGQLTVADYYLLSSRVVTPSGVRPGAVRVTNGVITAISHQSHLEPNVPVLDYKDAVISPGTIDAHVHLNEPGRAEWEGLATGTSAAAAGGVTSVVDMPLNSAPCTTTPQLLRQKVEVAREKSHVNIGFWAGLVPENHNDSKTLGGLLWEGALGFKSFMAPSGIDDFPMVEPDHIKTALPFLRHRGVPLFVHAEIVSNVVPRQGPPTEYATYLSTRPREFERDAIHALVELLAENRTKAVAGFRIHVAHLGDAASLPLIQAAKKANITITVETCAHYLSFAAEDIPDGKTVYKCAPPLRTKDNLEALRKAVLEGSIDLVSSDHSPAPPEMKEMESGNFLKAWGGISGLQYLLPATWTALKDDVSLVDLSQILSAAPADLAGWGGFKGKIAIGYHADIVVWDPESDADTSEASCQHKHKIGPYLGHPLKGEVLATFVMGNQVFSKEKGVSDTPCGNVFGRL